MWSDQLSQSFRFVTHIDGGPDTAAGWGPLETPLAGHAARRRPHQHQEHRRRRRRAHLRGDQDLARRRPVRPDDGRAHRAPRALERGRLDEPHVQHGGRRPDPSDGAPRRDEPADLRVRDVAGRRRLDLLQVEPAEQHLVRAGARHEVHHLAGRADRQRVVDQAAGQRGDRDGRARQRRAGLPLLPRRDEPRARSTPSDTTAPSVPGGSDAPRRCPRRAWTSPGRPRRTTSGSRATACSATAPRSARRRRRRSRTRPRRPGRPTATRSPPWTRPATRRRRAPPCPRPRRPAAHLGRRHVPRLELRREPDRVVVDDPGACRRPVG